MVMGKRFGTCRALPPTPYLIQLAPKEAQASQKKSSLKMIPNHSHLTQLVTERSAITDALHSCLLNSAKQNMLEQI